MDYIRKYKIYKLLGGDYITSDEKAIIDFVDNFLSNVNYYREENNNKDIRGNSIVNTFYYRKEKDEYIFLFSILSNHVNIRYDMFWREIEKKFWKYPYIDIKKFIIFRIEHIMNIQLKHINCYEIGSKIYDIDINNNEMKKL